MNPLPPTILAAALALAACATPTVTVRQDCQPINRYDTRCDEQSREAAQPPSPRPITLTRPHTVVYELTGHGTVLPIQVTENAGNQGHNVGDDMGQATAPWKYTVKDAPAGMTPLLRYPPDSDISCRVWIDGQDVTGEFPKSAMAANGVLEVCGATREP